MAWYVEVSDGLGWETDDRFECRVCAEERAEAIADGEILVRVRERRPSSHLTPVWSCVGHTAGRKP